jgi:HK97 family phage prohead protease
MDELVTRLASGLTVRAGSGSERIVEGIVLPWGQVTTVRDTYGPTGRLETYRETVPRGAVDISDPRRFVLEGPPVPGTAAGKHAGHLIGRGMSVEDRPEGLFVAFRVSSTPHGDEAYALAQDGILSDFSVGFRPVAQRMNKAGVMERTAIDVRRVALLDDGAYRDARVTAVRTASEDEMDPETTETTTPAAAPAAPVTPETPAAPTGEAQRAAAERQTVADLTARGGLQGAYITRPELVYGPAQRGASFLRDVIHRSDNPEAASRLNRHYTMLGDIVSRAGMIDDDGNPVIDWRRIERAGEVLTSELGGAIPTEFLPGLLVPRLLKGRPMAGFYQSFGITDARPRTFPKVSTSTSATVQSSEGTNPAASDFATTAETKTPALYGGSTLASRQALDSGDPSTEQMIMQDLHEAYAQVSETAVKTAVEAGATANSVTINDTAPFFGLVDQVIEFQTARFTPAEICFLPSAIYAALLKEPDGVTGRLQVPWLGPVNAGGQVQAGAAGASVLGVPHVLSWASTANKNVIGQSTDYVIYESAVADFRVENSSSITPANILLGVWAYLAVGVRRGSRLATSA